MNLHRINLFSRSFSLSGLIALGIVVSPMGGVSPASAVEVQVEGIKNMSKLIRSNAPYYWNFIKSKVPNQYSQWKKYQGMIMGDSHLGNFIVRPSDTKTSFALDYVNGDRDDAGVGPFAFDFAHFAITVKSETDDIKLPEMIEAYTAGINGARMAVPASLNQYLSTTETKYESLRLAFLAKNTKDGKFLLREEKLAPFDSQKLKLSQKQIAEALATTLLSGQKIFDYAIRPLEKGGSAKQRRIWILVGKEGAANSALRIYELKEKVESAVTEITPQESLPAVWTHSAQVFRLVEDKEPLITINNSYFILREKKVGLYDTPDADDESEFFKDLALYDSYLLGRWHSQQVRPELMSSFEDYKAALGADPDGFREMIKWLKKDFFEALEKERK